MPKQELMVPPPMNQPSATTLPPEIAKYNVWKMTFGSLEDAVGEEMRRYHPFVVLSNDEVANCFQCFALAPTTSELSKHGATKPLLLTVELPHAALGVNDNKKSLILTCQPDTMRATMLDSRVQKGGGNAHYLGVNLLHHKTIAEGCNVTLAQVLLDPDPDYRPVYPIGPNVNLSRGSVLELADYAPGNWNIGGATPPPPTTGHSFWVVISSSLWLHLLSNASKHSAGIAGLIRDVVVVAPILPGKPTPGEELIVELASPHPLFQHGAYCEYHRFRTRSLQRLVQVHPGLDPISLGDIDTGLRLFLDLH